MKIIVNKKSYKVDKYMEIKYSRYKMMISKEMKLPKWIIRTSRLLIFTIYKTEIFSKFRLSILVISMNFQDFYCILHLRLSTATVSPGSTQRLLLLMQNRIFISIINLLEYQRFQQNKIKIKPSSCLTFNKWKKK